MVEKLDLEYMDDNDIHGLKKTRIDDVNEGVLAQFESVADAVHFWQWYDGAYWKNNTLHVVFCPDSEIAPLETITQSAKLWVNNTGGMTDDQVHHAFHPIKLIDVQRPSHKSCLVFLEMTDALKCLDQYPGGKKLQGGRKIYAREDKKDVAKFALARTTQATKATTTETNTPVRPMPKAYSTMQAQNIKKPTIESLTKQAEAMDLGAKEACIKVHNLPSGTTNAEIGDLFKNYRLSSKAMSVNIGYVLVWLVSEPKAMRAVAVLNGSRFHGNTIKVEVSEA